MRAAPIGEPEKNELDGHVERILRDLASPEPPLKLEDVRTLLRLDKEYYSTNDESCLKEIVHRIRIAGKQVLENPSRLLDAIRQVKLSALWVPDSRKILLDLAEPKPKHRWMEGHEIAHSLASWHKDFLLGDDDTTLVHSCHEVLEAEANYGSGRLLFMGSRFASEALDLPRSMETVFELATRFGNSKPSTLWRYVYEALAATPCFGLILIHAKKSPTGAIQCKHVIESASFQIEFPELPSEVAASKVGMSFRNGRWGSVGSGAMTLTDRNGKNRVFNFEGYTNGHEIMVLGLPEAIR